MIRKLLVASAAVAAIAAYTAVTEPAQAGYTVVSAKARGLTQAGATGRSVKKLNHRISHWAHKKGLKVVRVGHVATACKKGPLVVCTSAAKVAP
jgi:hypothetical protein